jgi:hypothetical protein
VGAALERDGPGKAGDRVLGGRVGTAPGRGTWAETEPLLMMRPPGGACSRMTRYAACAQWKAPSRFVATTSRHCSGVTASNGALGPNMPALLNRRSIRPSRSRTSAKHASTSAASVTSTGATTADARPAAVSSSAARRRPASTTCQPSSSSAWAAARPMPDPAPVTTATLTQR